MSFTNTNDFLTGRKPVVTCDCSDVVAERYALDLVAADLDANDIGAVGILPAGCVPVGLLIDSDDLDTHATPTIVASDSKPVALIIAFPFSSCEQKRATGLGK